MAKALDRQRTVELNGLAERIDRDEQSDIKQKGRAIFDHHERLRAVLGTLKAQRERLGLSLADISERCGVDVAELCRLESVEGENVNLLSLMRYAEALGQRLNIAVV